MLLFHHFDAVARDIVLLFVLFISKCYCLAGKTLGLCYVPILPASRFSQWY